MGQTTTVREICQELFPKILDKDCKTASFTKSLSEQMHNQTRRKLGGVSISTPNQFEKLPSLEDSDRKVPLLAAKY
jgi:hypothetical protein